MRLVNGDLACGNLIAHRMSRAGWVGVEGGGGPRVDLEWRVNNKEYGMGIVKSGIEDCGQQGVQN